MRARADEAADGLIGNRTQVANREAVCGRVLVEVVHAHAGLCADGLQLGIDLVVRETLAMPAPSWHVRERGLFCVGRGACGDGARTWRTRL